MSGSQPPQTAASTPRRLAIFAHFDAQGEVKRFVLHHLEALRTVCESVVFVSNSEVNAADRATLAALCTQVLVRENTGYDFSMWQHALGVTDLSQWDELVLTNSSIVGPVYPLAQAFSSMQPSTADFWGMTENAEFARHVQSYFLVFRRTALASAAFSQFWPTVLPYRNKYQTIRSYELGLTAYLVDQGLTYSTLASPDLAQRRWPLKPVHDVTLRRPLQLLKAGMPYVKISLLRSNPERVALEPVRHAMQAAGYDLSLVEFDSR